MLRIRRKDEYRALSEYSFNLTKHDLLYRAMTPAMIEKVNHINEAFRQYKLRETGSDIWKFPVVVDKSQNTITLKLDSENIEFIVVD